MIRTVASLLAATLLVCDTTCADEPTILLDGSYDVRMRLEVPNVHNWYWSTTHTICVPAAGSDGPPIPVLSGNNPVAACPASDIRREGNVLTFAIVCPGRNPSKALASYRLTETSFEGRIAMVMGAKNMTFTEVQSGHWTGACERTSASAE